MENFEQAVRGWQWKALRYFESTGSTNDEAGRWLAEGAPHLAVVVANHQTMGRGRLKRCWYTPPDAALAFSVILKDALPETSSIQPNLARITALGALAVCRALEKCYQLEPEIKWPNDVLVAGKKIAGILTEAHWMGATLTGIIIGIGINIAHSSIPTNRIIAFPATCVEDCLPTRSGPISNRERAGILFTVLGELTEIQPRLYTQDFIKQWEAGLAFKNQWVEAYTDYESHQGRLNQPSVKGKLTGISPAGELCLRTKDGALIKLETGDIHLRASPALRRGRKRKLTGE